jgi:hypothetical protein
MHTHKEERFMDDEKVIEIKRRRDIKRTERERERQ